MILKNTVKKIFMTYKKKIKVSKNFYFKKKNTSRNIVNVLVNFPLKNLIKKFYESSKTTRI